MTHYQMKFQNQTDTTYHFGVYQKYPSSPGLKSVVWQVRGVPEKGQNRVDWTMDYGVAIAEWDEDGSAYSGQQIRPAQLGKAYQVILEDGDIPSIDPNPVAGQSVTPNQIKLINNTNTELDLGFTVAGNIIAVTHAQGNETANYIVHPTYYVALYREVKLGKLVDSGLEVGPVETKFEYGNTKAMIQSVKEAGKIVLKPPVYS